MPIDIETCLRVLKANHLQVKLQTGFMFGGLLWFPEVSRHYVRLSLFEMLHNISVRY